MTADTYTQTRKTTTAAIEPTADRGCNDAQLRGTAALEATGFDDASRPIVRHRKDRPDNAHHLVVRVRALDMFVGVEQLANECGPPPIIECPEPSYLK